MIPGGHAGCLRVADQLERARAAGTGMPLRRGGSGSACYPAPVDFRRVLESLLAFCEREQVRVAVVGAFGLAAYGRARATVDLDVAIEARAQPRLVGFLESLGYETLHLSEGYSNHLHPDPVLGRVDVIYLGGDTAKRLFDGCRALMHLGERAVPVPRAEHLAAMKVHAMKNDPARTLQELADIRLLLGLPGVDEDEVRGYFERAGLRDRFDELKRLG